MLIFINPKHNISTNIMLKFPTTEKNIIKSIRNEDPFLQAAPGGQHPPDSVRSHTSSTYLRSKIETPLLIQSPLKILRNPTCPYSNLIRVRQMGEQFINKF